MAASGLVAKNLSSYRSSLAGGKLVVAQARADTGGASHVCPKGPMSTLLEEVHPVERRAAPECSAERVGAVVGPTVC